MASQRKCRPTSSLLKQTLACCQVHVNLKQLHACRQFLSRDDIMLCLCVCPSITFVNSVKTNKHIFKISSPSGSHTILIFFRTNRYGTVPTETALLLIFKKIL